MYSFMDKVAIVTGGASGIGRAVCEHMGQRGAILVVADINTEGARAVAQSITTSGGRARAVELDVTQQEDVRKLIKETAEEHGRLDYMFNNAGIGIFGDERDKTFEDWQKILNINLYGVLYGTLAAYSLMAEQGFGHIINTASLAGLIPAPTDVAYSTSKHAVVGLSTSLRAEGAGLGVKVSVVCPGVVRTPIFDTSPVLNASKDDLMARLPSSVMLDVNKAARAILRGVVRNKGRIVFPFHARFAWMIDRILPSLSDLWAQWHIKTFRTFRKEPGTR